VAVARRAWGSAAGIAGRGDGLAAIDEATLGSVVDAAALIAAITCSRPGADPPTRAEVDAALAAQ
jgi:fructokinase